MGASGVESSLNNFGLYPEKQEIEGAWGALIGWVTLFRCPQARRGHGRVHGPWPDSQALCAARNRRPGMGCAHGPSGPFGFCVCFGRMYENVCVSALKAFLSLSLFLFFFLSLCALFTAAFLPGKRARHKLLYRTATDLRCLGGNPEESCRPLAVVVDDNLSLAGPTARCVCSKKHVEQSTCLTGATRMYSSPDFF